MVCTHKIIHMEKYADLQVDDIRFPVCGEGMKVQWSSDSLGFGEVTLEKVGDKITVDTEAMSKDFVKALFDKVVDKLIP
jgi:hypothetical protein